MKNAEIAAALDELADLNELDGAVVYRVVAYRQAARAVRESPVAVEQLAEQGRLTKLQGSRQDDRGEDRDAARDRRDPGGGQAEEQVPARPRRAHAAARASGRRPRARSTRSSASHRSRSCARRRDGGAPARRAGAGREGRAQHPRGARDADGEARPTAGCFRTCCRSPKQIVEELRAHPAADRVELAGSLRRWTETCKDIDIVAATRRAARPGRGARGTRCGARGGVGRRRRHQDRHPQRDCGRAESRGAGASSATCSST